MKNIRFFHEFDNKRLGKSAGNVLAVDMSGLPFVGDGGQVCRTAIGGIVAEPNSPVCTTTVALEYLRVRAKRVGESEARRIHPNLFRMLDMAA